MIASLYRLSRKDLSALKVTDEYSLHRIVYDLFPERESGDNGRDFLYADKGGDFRERIILVLSCRPPASNPWQAGSNRARLRRVSFPETDTPLKRL